jgi:hypothetical protein
MGSTVGIKLIHPIEHGGFIVRHVRIVRGGYSVVLLSRLTEGGYAGCFGVEVVYSFGTGLKTSGYNITVCF